MCLHLGLPLFTYYLFPFSFLISPLSCLLLSFLVFPFTYYVFDGIIYTTFLEVAGKVIKQILNFPCYIWYHVWTQEVSLQDDPLPTPVSGTHLHTRQVHPTGPWFWLPSKHASESSGGEVPSFLVPARVSFSLTSLWDALQWPLGAGLLAANVLGLPASETVSVPPSLQEDTLAGRRTPSEVTGLCFQHFREGVELPSTPLLLRAVVTLAVCCAPGSVKRAFSFQQADYDVSVCGVPGFILFEVHLASWICRFLSSPSLVSF